MAQASRPQQGFFDAVTLPDSGPYTDHEWGALLALFNRTGGVVSTAAEGGLLRTPTTVQNMGVYYAVDNQLEVTAPGGAGDVQIDTGACIVGGVMHYNNTALTINIPINRTNDLIVVRQNWSNATYVPPASADANEEVPPDTARISRVTALVRDTTLATYWDIPLADVSTDGAGVVTINSDDREWSDAEVKYRYVAPMSGENITDGTTIAPTHIAGAVLNPAFSLLDLKDCRVSGYWTAPEDFITTLTVESLGNGNAVGGDIYALTKWDSCACNQGILTITQSTGLGTQTQAAVDYRQAIICYRPLSVNDGNVVASNHVRLEFRRDATDPLDTLGTFIQAIGWRVSYLGWGRR